MQIATNAKAEQWRAEQQCRTAKERFRIAVEYQGNIFDSRMQAVEDRCRIAEDGMQAAQAEVQQILHQWSVPNLCIPMVSCRTSVTVVDCIYLTRSRP